MNLSNHPAVKHLGTAFTFLKKNPLLLIAACLLDAAFFFAWGFYTTPINERIVEQAILVANSAGENLKQGNLSALLPLNPQILSLLGILFITSFLLYVIFHGTNWWIAQKLVNRKTGYKQYVLGFAKVNLLWLLAYALYRIFDVIIALRATIVEKLAPGLPNIAAYFLFAFLLVMTFAALFSYPTLKARTLFTTPLNISSPLTLLTLSVFLAAHYVANLFEYIHPDAALIAGILLVLPMLTYLRVYITTVITNVHARN